MSIKKTRSNAGSFLAGGDFIAAWLQTVLTKYIVIAAYKNHHLFLCRSAWLPESHKHHPFHYLQQKQGWLYFIRCVGNSKAPLKNGIKKRLPGGDNRFAHPIKLFSSETGSQTNHISYAIIRPMLEPDFSLML